MGRFLRICNREMKSEASKKHKENTFPLLNLFNVNPELSVNISSFSLKINK